MHRNLITLWQHYDELKRASTAEWRLPVLVEAHLNGDPVGHLIGGGHVYCVLIIGFCIRLLLSFLYRLRVYEVTGVGKRVRGHRIYGR